MANDMRVEIIPAVEFSTSILDGMVLGDEDTGLWVAWLDAYHHWLEAKRRRNDTGSTAMNYETAWKQFFRWAQVRPWEVLPEMAERWAAHLMFEGKPVVDRKSGQVLRREPLAQSTFNLKLAALGDFYRYVQKKYDLWPADKRNPFDVVDRLKVTPYGKAKYPSTDEAKTMLAAINTECLTGKRDFALLYTILVTCRRSSEVLNLRWGDLVETDSGDYAFQYRYKGGKIKKAVLNKQCYTAIKTYLGADGRGETIGADDYVFIPLDEERVLRFGGPLRPFDRLTAQGEDSPNPQGEGAGPKPISNSLANRILKKYARRAGVDSTKAHIHGLRHAGARLRVQLMKGQGKGIDFEEIRNLLGHSSLAVTQVYTMTTLDDPVDVGGQAAAESLLPKGKVRRKKKAVGEQMAMAMSNEQ
jgi:integrase/recombinase XerD